PVLLHQPHRIKEETLSHSRLALSLVLDVDQNESRLIAQLHTRYQIHNSPAKPAPAGSHQLLIEEGHRTRPDFARQLGKEQVKKLAEECAQQLFGVGIVRNHPSWI